MIGKNLPKPTGTSNDKAFSVLLFVLSGSFRLVF